MYDSMPQPPASSSPDQASGNSVVAVSGGSGATLLIGAPASIVLKTSLVSIGSLLSKMMVAWLRYLDTFTKVDGTWYIAERQIILEWSETRPLGVPTAG